MTYMYQYVHSHRVICDIISSGVFSKMACCPLKIDISMRCILLWSNYLWFNPDNVVPGRLSEFQRSILCGSVKNAAVATEGK
jgi:hypothetical protein